MTLLMITAYFLIIIRYISKVKINEENKEKEISNHKIIK